MTQKKNIVNLFVLLLIASLALAACGGNNTSTDGAGNNDNNSSSTTTEDGSSNSSTDNNSGDDDDDDEMDMESMELTGDFTMDAALIADSDSDSLTAAGYVYEGLVTMQDGSVSPGIAMSWEVSDDGLSYEFTLRPNAVFTDGTPVTADVVRTNFYRWFDPTNELHGDSSGYQAWQSDFLGFLGEYDDEGLPLSLFDGAEKVDNLTVLLHLNEPVDNMLEILTKPQFSILQPAVLAGSCCASADTVVGSGPYVIMSWSGDTMTLMPSDTYWGN